MDYTAIKEQFRDVVANVYNWNNEEDKAILKFDKLFEDWYAQKKWMIDRMGGLIYECPRQITIRLSETARSLKANGFIEWVSADFGYDVGSFLERNKGSLYDNKVEDDCDITGINVGMKIGKALKFFNRDFGGYLTAEDVSLIQERLSMLIQENKVTGTLCLSVHPLDFLSVSENQHNWRSCHALNGEYCSGNLTYMNDSCTFIAYLKSSEDVILPRFPKSVPWNNKKWRCLFFWDKDRDLIWAGRQYPFESESCLYEVSENLLKPCSLLPASESATNPFHRSEWIHQTSKEVTIGNEIYRTAVPTFYYENKAISLDSIIQDHSDSMHFNDLLNSSCYTPYCYVGARASVSKVLSSPPMTIGGPVQCPVCGKHNIELSELMLCKECMLEYTDYEDSDLVTTCSCCGQRLLADDAKYYCGEAYCDSCYDSLNLVTCSVCGEEHPKDDSYEDENGVAYCSWCWRERTRHGKPLNWIDAIFG